LTGSISNTASIASPVNPQGNNKSVTDTTAIVAQASLSISVTAPVSVTVDSTLTYNVNITNDGPAPASALELATLLPAGAAVVTYTVSSPITAPVCEPLIGRVHCALGALPAGGILQMNIVVIAPPTAGSLETYWDILAPELDPDEANNRVTNTVLVY